MIFDGRALDPILNPIEKVQAALLATIITYPESLPRAIGFGASVVWFERPLFEDIWKALIQLHSEVGCADWITVNRAVETKWTAEGVATDGLWDEILGVWEYQATPAMLKGYCAQLRSHEASKRASGIMHQTLPTSASDLAEDLLKKAAALNNLATYAKADGSENPDAVWDRVDDELHKSREEGTFGIETGIPPLDATFRGWRPGEMIVLGARPGIGKSSMAVTIAANLKAKDPASVILYASPEMRVEDIAKRLISCRSSVPVTAVESGFCSKEHRDRWADSASYFRTNGIEIRHAGMNDPQAVYSAAQAAKLKHGRLDLVIVDHMHIMRGEGKSPEERIAGVSKALLILANELSVPLLALAQLNRLVEHREDPAPSLADIRGSGAIEEDGAIIFFLHRPKKTDPSKIVVTIAKNRRGQQPTIELDFKNSISRFEWSGPKNAEEWNP